MDDGSAFGQLRNLLKQGVDPNVIRTLGPGGAQAFSGAKARTAEAGQQTLAGARQLGQAAIQRPGMYGTLGTAGLVGGQQLLQGDVLGALAGTAGGLAGGGIGTALAGLIPGPAGKVAKFALPALGGLVGGVGAEQAAGALAGKAQEAGQRPGGTDIEIPGIGPVTEAAYTRRQRELDRAQTLQDIQQIGAAQFALNKELYSYALTKEVEQAKAMAPIMERAQRAQLTNAQAMLNSETAALQQLGRAATMGKLAAIGQQERGATMRQALATNPYIGATLQAPQISFG